MAILGNFYACLGILLVILLVLQEESTSLMHKLGVLLVLSLGILWLDKPEIFHRIWWEIKSRMDTGFISGI